MFFSYVDRQCAHSKLSHLVTRAPILVKFGRLTACLEYFKCAKSGEDPPVGGKLALTCATTYNGVYGSKNENVCFWVCCVQGWTEGRFSFNLALYFAKSDEKLMSYDF